MNMPIQVLKITNLSGSASVYKKYGSHDKHNTMCLGSSWLNVKFLKSNLAKLSCKLYQELRYNRI